MAERRGFTETVRQEVSGLELGDAASVHSELAAIVRLSGTVTLGSAEPRLGLQVTTSSGAVARRTHALFIRAFSLHPTLLVRAPGGLHRSSTYVVGLADTARRVGIRLGILTSGGGLVDGVPARACVDRVAWLRGAVLACASISAPGRTPHLELSVTSPAVAEHLAALLRDQLATSVHVGQTTDRRGATRVVVKSGEAIGELLALVGAPQAFLEWDDRRLRRQLRNDANRLANADSANLQKTIAASASQIDALEAVIATHGWEVLDDEAREVALARMSNPEASLAELGQLLQPPVTKSTVQRRLRRALRAGRADGPAATNSHR